MTEEIKGKVLYTPKGPAREYAAIGCNFYNGCPHNCQYCYLKRGALSKTMGGIEATLKKCFKNEEHALQCFKEDCETYHDYLKQTGIFFSFSTDPMLKETYKLTAQAAAFAVKNDIPVKILTKCDMLPGEFLSGHPHIRPEMVAMGFTLTGRDDMEPYAPSNEKRIEAMRMYKERGFRTFASIEPVIDFTNSRIVMEQAAPYCDLFKIGLRSGVARDCYDPNQCALFLGQVTGMSERYGFMVYWKRSIRNYVKKNLTELSEALTCFRNFVDRDYDMFV